MKTSPRGEMLFPMVLLRRVGVLVALLTLPVLLALASHTLAARPGPPQIDDIAKTPASLPAGTAVNGTTDDADTADTADDTDAANRTVPGKVLRPKPSPRPVQTASSTSNGSTREVQPERRVTRQVTPSDDDDDADDADDRDDADDGDD